jgi:uncharacterized phage-associated protein
MAARSDSVCKFICEAGDWQVTNLQLQKILYFAQMVYLGMTNERLADTGFEAWDYGPVAPSVYRQVRMFGSSPIKDIFIDARPFSANSKRRDVLSDACRDLLSLRPGELVEITHWNQGAWAKNYVPGAKGLRIPDSAIIEEYRARLKAGHIKED